MVCVCVVALLAVPTTAVVTTDTAFAAQSAEVLRNVLGDENVARLESWVLGLQDLLQSWVYDVGGDPPQAPFASPTPAPVVASLASSPTPTPRPTSANASGTPRPASTATPMGVIPTLPPAPTAPPNDLPAPLKPMGHVAGEGVWSEFITSPSGQPVGYRTFLQPDPQRAYALSAVVALDLTATRLHYVLGSVEPVSPDTTIDRPGRIPNADIKSGLVIAAFNGGFRARHGNFGVMANGTVAIAPRIGLGTVAMFDDGRVAIGTWGAEVFYATGLRNWRQNGPLILHNGQINRHTADTAPEDWGYSLDGHTATWRSGLGLSADGHTLYYVAGPFLTLPVLAQVMAATGAANAVQLDINSYWVNFDAIISGSGGPVSVPMMDGMKNDDRYLHVFERDFFYVMAVGN